MKKVVLFLLEWLFLNSPAEETYFSLHSMPSFYLPPRHWEPRDYLMHKMLKDSEVNIDDYATALKRKAILWLGTYLSSLEWQPCGHINNPREAQLQNCHSADSLTRHLLFWEISSWIKAHQHLLSGGALILLVKIQCYSILWLTTAL